MLAGFKGELSNYQDAVKASKSIYGDEEKGHRILVRCFIYLGKPKYTKSNILNFKTELENLLTHMSHDPQIDITSNQWLIPELVCLKLPKEAEDFIFNLHKTMYSTLL